MPHIKICQLSKYLSINLIATNQLIGAALIDESKEICKMNYLMLA